MTLTATSASFDLLVHELQQEIARMHQTKASVLILGEKADRTMFATWLATQFPNAILHHDTDEMSLEKQHTLCTHLKQQKVTGLRIIATANNNIFTKVQQGTCSAELYALLAEMPIELLPHFINHQTITMLNNKADSTAV